MCDATKERCFSLKALIAGGCLLAAVGWCPCTMAAEPVNLIADPGFEAGIRAWVAQGGKIALAREPRQAHAGSNAVRVLTGPEGKQSAGRLYCSKRVDVVPGARYALSAWVKGQGQASLGVYEYSLEDGTPKYRQRVSMPTAEPLSSEWRQVAFVYRPADERVVSAATRSPG